MAPDNIPRKPKYTIHEISLYLNSIQTSLLPKTEDIFYKCIHALSKKEIASVIDDIASWTSTVQSIGSKKRKKNDMIKQIFHYVKHSSIDENCNGCMGRLGHMVSILRKVGHTTFPYFPLYQKIEDQQKEIAKCSKMMSSIADTLDQSIYGHHHAKTELTKIIGQWINGEQSGYCFGFEGAPGLGKTSLAKKGLAKCLHDEHGVSRPFAFIAMGGSSNGSTLEGHNYTYLNSTWGKIVDILMESGCMNPIIYIDELDKVSKTEQGKEIIGILMHLIDQSQNDEFYDKYFNIPVDLSKALFIFSYNDPDQIDRVLLDRIHRIKFEPLSTKEKIVIAKQFIIPELEQKMGFHNTIDMDDCVIEYIIETYTLEPGVRKLKELLFDLFGEINILLLKSSENSQTYHEGPKNIVKMSDTNRSFPIHISIADLGNIYLTHYIKIKKNSIHQSPSIGRINGLWANQYGRGGIIPIETVFFPSSSFFELKLTGLQGDVMKESMNVAKSLAWSLTPTKTQQALVKSCATTNTQGIHIHCPEGAVSKDGPSAGAAITLAIYSLLNSKRISNTIGITGEVNLQGEIMAIGGLEHKILGAISAGVTTLLYPEANSSEYNMFVKKNKDHIDLSRIRCIQISTIQEVLDYAVII
jgi:ATP-dependent Lon protease